MNYGSKWLLGFLVLGGTMAVAAYGVSSPVISSYNGQTVDSNAQIATPTTLQELQKVIQEAAAQRKQIRIAGASHSTSSLILSDSSFYIRTTGLNHIGAIEERNGEHFVTVEAGVKLGELSDTLAARGYSLGFAFPAFRGLTMAGLEATGSHGSSRRYTAISTQTVDELELVTARGDLLKITPQDGELFKAATVNLGLLGVVYRIRFRIVPQFNLKVTSRWMDFSKESLSDFLKGPAQEDYLFVLWFPNQNGAIIESGVMTTEAADPGAENVNLGLNQPPTVSDYAISKAFAMGRLDPTGATDAMLEKKRVEGLIAAPRFLLQKDGKDLPSPVVIGPSNKMTLARGDDIKWPYTLSDNSFAFPIESLDEVMTTIRDFAKKNNYSFPIAGISMRFGHSDGGRSSFLSHVEDGSGQRKLYVLAEFLEYKALNSGPVGHSGRDALRDQLMEALITQNKVHLHWGKNNDLSMKQWSQQPVIQSAYARFERIRRELDPDGVFLPKYIRGLFGI